MSFKLANLPEEPQLSPQEAREQINDLHRTIRNLRDELTEARKGAIWQHCQIQHLAQIIHKFSRDVEALTEEELLQISEINQSFAHFHLGTPNP